MHPSLSLDSINPGYFYRENWVGISIYAYRAIWFKFHTNKPGKLQNFVPEKAKVYNFQKRLKLVQIQNYY